VVPCLTPWRHAFLAVGLVLTASSCATSEPGGVTGAAGSGGGNAGSGGSGAAGSAGSGTAGSGGSGTAGSSGSGNAGSGGSANAGSAGSGNAGDGGSGNAGGAGSGAGGSAGSGAGGRGGSGAGGRGGAGAGTAGTTGTGGTAPGGPRTAAETCARWKADRANLSEGTWSGNVASCTVGDISADGRANALRLFNLYRWFADLPAVVTEASRDAQAQACALIMDANPTLSHDPQPSWICYTSLGAMGAMTSNISSGPGVSSVAAYMIDSGNESTFGHRRIILSNRLGPIGLGSTGPGGASCMQNIGGTGNAGKAWVAWPPPGPFPMQAYGSGTRSLSTTGWSVQTQRSIALTGASVSVTVTAGGAAAPVTVSQSTGSYGESNAIRIVPMGWTPAAGQSYTVTVSGVSTPISYTVEFVDCP
jgi:hypothetical protein